MSNILSDNDARTPIFGAHSPLYIPGYQVAAKTGTTQNFVDGWTMGYTPFAVVGVWTGNNNNTPTTDTGVGVTAPMWNKIMTKILLSHPVENFVEPDPITDRGPVLLGQLPPNDTNSILFYVNQNSPQYPLWQIGINNWLISTGQFQQAATSTTLP